MQEPKFFNVKPEKKITIIRQTTKTISGGREIVVRVTKGSISKRLPLKNINSKRIPIFTNGK